MPPPVDERTLYRKVARRLIPLLFVCYILAYLDRINVGFAKHQMSLDLGLSDTVYGTAAGIFFIGYLLFEVPSNLILARVGAKAWIGRIMISWGIVAILQLLVSGPVSFFAMRFLLGVAEAGFFPGIILYLTFWFPADYRARMVAWFMTAVALAGVVGGPVSGWILHSMDGTAGLKGWKWLYLLEGLPSLLTGLFVLMVMDNSPAQASWLSEEEKKLLRERKVDEEARKQQAGVTGHEVADALGNPKVWLLAALYFFIVMGLYGISFWLPQIIRETITTDEQSIGWISAIPWLASAVCMVAVGGHSDRTGERSWHIAGACLAGSIAFAACSMPEVSGWYGILALSVATCGIMSALSCFWTLPSALLSGTAAAAGIALVNSVGNVAGYVSPEMAGMVRDATGHRMDIVLLVFAASLLVAALLTLKATRLIETTPSTASSPASGFGR
jgi:D-galactonate transporter